YGSAWSIVVNRTARERVFIDVVNSLRRVDIRHHLIFRIEVKAIIGRIRYGQMIVSVVFHDFEERIAARLLPISDINHQTKILTSAKLSYPRRMSFPLLAWRMSKFKVPRRAF